jgi:hypothetical protein
MIRGMFFGTKKIFRLNNNGAVSKSRAYPDLFCQPFLIGSNEPLGLCCWVIRSLIISEYMYVRVALEKSSGSAVPPLPKGKELQIN